MNTFPTPGDGGTSDFWMARGKSGERPGAQKAREEQDELIRRLRALEWPAPAPEVRDRCLADFERRLAELEEPTPPRYD